MKDMGINLTVIGEISHIICMSQSISQPPHHHLSLMSEWRYQHDNQLQLIHCMHNLHQSDAFYHSLSLTVTITHYGKHEYPTVRVSADGVRMQSE